MGGEERMMTIDFSDVMRGFERSYSRLADNAAEYLFFGATWFARGSWMEIGLKVGVVAFVLGAIHYALGGQQAMGDKKPLGPAIMWGVVAVFAGLVAFSVMIKS
jgi:hypothetical protein